MNLREFDLSNPFQATLVASTPLTGAGADTEVRHLALDVAGGDFEFREGQSVAVLVPGPHEFGARQHLRLYSIASPRLSEQEGAARFSLCVRRCFYIDEISGERYRGRASNYLCDAEPGDQITIAGPFGAPFTIPQDDTANLLLVGAGTGIAPFRALVRRIYAKHGGWRGRVRLYFGAKTGMELLYMNDANRDLALYYDQPTFRAFQALSPRPHFDAPAALDRALAENIPEIRELVLQPNTYVYIAGLSIAAAQFQAVMENAGPPAWADRRQELIREGRYAELLYD